MYELEKFGEYLEERELVRSNRIPFFVSWIRWYLSSGSVSAEEFSDFLGSSGKAEWQIRQALDALNHYSVWTGDSCFSTESGPCLAVMRKALRVRHYSLRTEKCYSHWCSKYLAFCSGKSIDEKTSDAFQRYLSHLALVRHVAASTQNQAFNALLFLFRHVWGIEPEGVDAVRARKPVRIPEVLSTAEVKAVLDETKGTAGLVIRLIYSSGMRLCEAMSVRFKDVNLSSCSIQVRGGKGDKDRVTIMGRNLVPDLSRHMDRVNASWVRGGSPVSLPAAIHRKYPTAGQSAAWRYIFPGRFPSLSPRTGKLVIHHMHQSAVQREMRRAVLASGISKRAGVHTLRHCFATHLLLSGVDLCEIQELLGHKSLETTRIYIHLAKGLRNQLRSPLDLLSDGSCDTYGLRPSSAE